MLRSLSRHIHRASAHSLRCPVRDWDRVPHRAGSVSVVLSFPDTAFPDEPAWSPGRGFTECIDTRSWLRDNRDGTHTAVATITEPDDSDHVVTVRLPSTHYAIGELYDKPHRLRRALAEPGVTVVDHTPYDQHPLAALHAHWGTFNNQWGFVPLRRFIGRYPFADRRRWTTMTADLDCPGRPGLYDLARATAHLCSAFGARARAYPWDRNTGRYRSPVHGGDMLPVLEKVLTSPAYSHH
ncbi:hypothetical protein AB0B04_18935 [Streptomyces xinghaiensis]|uniref:Uncharacterized protein n=2 Tax=Streptomyces TaxID=1883 RepID=A0A3M8EYI0_9ACTN|nr:MULTISPECIES: hypothetical protein [Streptomyces]KNE78787.1 hypothetical protein ADZ36_31235 [Streptomyces fradiae]OFA36645.1 hypothetical protein BEN35_29760 [Streptomyces fradiae]PQM20642.1 hypothetical protein Sfr7A_26005 [Streptomyces xinghaiensis]RKM92583.1 hypothetical protein SFRA_024660 [Streptomyces xinghaiensis]RNC70551.1 hypothetical protein DC095_025650 [Streptomyces xinghaiensis]